MRVAPDYYDWSLEARRAALGAPSVFCLCKSMVKRAHCCCGVAADLGAPNSDIAQAELGQALHV